MTANVSPNAVMLAVILVIVIGTIRLVDQTQIMFLVSHVCRFASHATVAAKACLLTVVAAAAILP